MAQALDAIQIPFEVLPAADGAVAGPLRSPRNIEQDLPNSIHNDAVAQKLGLRGGTVAGSLHMEQFPSLLIAVLGPEWWSKGGLSLYFKYATTDLEAVQCFARRPGSGDVGEQVPTWMDTEDGRRVAEGTAWVGRPAGRTALAERAANVPDPRDLRIFRDFHGEHEMRGIPVRVEEEVLARRLDVIVEPLDEYVVPDRYGERVLPPSMLVRALTAYHNTMLQDWPDLGVGLYGAIEIEHLAGPCFVEHDYEVRGRVLAVGETPRTEYLWYESVLSEPSGGVDRARMLMMLRFMKDSSPAWQR
ncbi:MAG: hypothetical protein F4X99_06425 [Gammaproteobacteria bacterium]|nr:hypothetical protein [Gammaproteobacteria bacterium]